MEMTIDDDGEFCVDGRSISSKQVSTLVKIAQAELAADNFSQKTIHGVFWNQVRKPGFDALASNGWLVHGRFQSETESLVVAAQDGVVLTKAYCCRVLREVVSESCSVCSARPETIGHILSGCKSLSWTLYKERHDRILYQVVYGLCKRYDILVPDSARPVGRVPPFSRA